MAYDFGEHWKLKLVFIWLLDHYMLKYRVRNGDNNCIGIHVNMLNPNDSSIVVMTFMVLFVNFYYALTERMMLLFCNVVLFAWSVTMLL